MMSRFPSELKPENVVAVVDGGTMPPKKNTRPRTFPGPLDQGNGWLVIAFAVACCTVKHSLASPRRGTYELSPIVMGKSSRNQAKAVQYRRPNRCKVFRAYDMRNIHPFSRRRMFSDANPIQTPKSHRDHHVALGPMSFSSQRFGQRRILQFVVPLFDWVWFRGRNGHHGNQLLVGLGQNDYRPFLNHFGRPKTGTKITDQNLAGFRMKIDGLHDLANIHNHT